MEGTVGGKHARWGRRYNDVMVCVACTCEQTVVHLKFPLSLKSGSIYWIQLSPIPDFISCDIVRRVSFCERRQRFELSGSYWIPSSRKNANFLHEYLRHRLPHTWLMLNHNRPAKPFGNRNIYLRGSFQFSIVIILNRAWSRPILPCPSPHWLHMNGL